MPKPKKDISEIIRNKTKRKGNKIPAIFSACLSVVVSVFLVGCVEITELKYIGGNKNAIPAGKLRIVDRYFNLYSEEVSLSEGITKEKISLGVIDFVDTICVIVKIDNTIRNVPAVVYRTDFSARTNDNYTLRAISPDGVLYEAQANAQVSLRDAQNMKVDTKVISNTDSYAYASGSGYIDSSTRYSGNTAYTNGAVYGNASTYGHSATTTKIEDDPGQALGKSLAVSMAQADAKTYGKYAKIMSVHALTDFLVVQPNNWDYAFLFFERPLNYPSMLEISYKGMTYIFSR